jgi:hypothetical protein
MDCACRLCAGFDPVSHWLAIFPGMTEFVSHSDSSEPGMTESAFLESGKTGSECGRYPVMRVVYQPKPDFFARLQ